jgi:hypothetical protein
MNCRIASNGMLYELRKGRNMGFMLVFPSYQVFFKRDENLVLGGEVWRDGQSWAWTPNPGRKHASDCDRRVDAINELAKHVGGIWRSTP